MKKKIYGYKSSLQHQLKYNFKMEQNEDFQDEMLSPEDFDFSDYEESDYDSLEDK